MFGKAFVALSLAASALGQGLTVSSPTLIQCQPALISFSGSTNSPFTLAVIPGGEPSASALEFLSTTITSSPYTWTVNLAAGTNVSLKISDSSGAVQYGAPTVIQQGATDSCLNASASTSGIATTAAITTTNTNTMTTATASAVTSGSAGTTSASPSSSSSMTSMMSSAGASSATSAAGSATSAAGSAAGSATSAAASAASSAATGAGFAQAVAGLPAIFAALLGYVVLA